MTLRKKCRTCRVAQRVSGCLFSCNKKERLMRELDLLVRDAGSYIDPVVEQLKQCPEAFAAGKAIEQLFHSAGLDPVETGERILPPPGAVMSPCV